MHNRPMSPADGKITHVSDTALMVAACRALETDRPDGFVRDPFASRLAGDRGMAILQGLPETYSRMMCFGMGIRSHFMDELLLEILGTHPISTVLNVGCGLDTRPWRLDLPANLRWIEVDFPDMLDYKESLMSGEAPRCRRERLTVDLNDAAQRESLYVAAGTSPAFLITEGLLMYLPGKTIESFAVEVLQRTPITHWMSDANTTTFSKLLKADFISPIAHVQAPDCIPGEQILDVIHRAGWNTVAHRSYMRDLDFAKERIERMTAGQPRPEPPPEFKTDPTGIHVFGR